jgi:hypothetical protein
VTNPEDILAEAAKEFEAERHRLAVEAEVARLHTRSHRSIWQRVVDALPFTITWKKK